jgi:hypothetical protein
VFGVDDEADVRWVTSKLVLHPLRTTTEPLRLTAPLRLPRTYVYCSFRPMGFFEQFRDRAQRDGWPVHVLDTGHDAMITEPQRVASILLGV